MWRRCPTPAGDDVGDGTLLYPTGGVLQPGDLDLRSLRIHRDADGYWFTATFGNFIHENWWSPKGDDAGEFSKQGQHRLPFGFNLDIYIDTDRKSGSGNLFTLPGRQARIDRRYAWERVVVLSPRPQAMRSHLLGKLRETFPGRPESEAEASIDGTMYFAAYRQKLDRSVSFFVPNAFLGDSDPTKWAVTAFVTVAAAVVDAKDLGVMQPSRRAILKHAWPHLDNPAATPDRRAAADRRAAIQGTVLRLAADRLFSGEQCGDRRRR